MSNYLFIFGVNGFNVGERLCYNRSSFLRLPFDIPYMPVFSFYDVLNLLRSSSFNTCLQHSHVNDFTCLRLSHASPLPILYDYLVLYKPPCNVLNGSLVFIVNLSRYRLSPLDGLIDNLPLTLLLSLSAGTPLRNLQCLCNRVTKLTNERNTSGGICIYDAAC